MKLLYWNTCRKECPLKSHVQDVAEKVTRSNKVNFIQPAESNKIPCVRIKLKRITQLWMCHTHH